MAYLTAMPEFHTWQRGNPTFKQQLTGDLWTPQGLLRVTVLLDTGATHCFICARLTAGLTYDPRVNPAPRLSRQRRQGSRWSSSHLC